MKRNLIVLNATDVADNLGFSEVPISGFYEVPIINYNKIYKDEHRMKGALSC